MYQPSTIERLMGSKNKSFSRAEDLGEAKMFINTMHPIHEGTPFQPQTEKRQYSRAPHIEGDEPIGDVAKVKQQRVDQYKQQMKILAMSMNPNTISSNV